ncbi:hypothetical protein N7468_005206 [Penicillium chermesinum]|uniref:Uncharacterized protein n=1 Tax=Penicillium chermesinum TaxID=63820 RepID=A0A9W9NYZ4_9EURO|nr:uncharacterized protein N7468_005206 [Penicillium chermesinum]KAJ5232250.1 hypothetical protein N7468_005206 [Penicillium chermesinum]
MPATTLKSGLMACKATEMGSFAAALEDHKADCLQRLHTYKSTVKETQWENTGDEAGRPFSDEEKAHLPIATQIPRTKRGSPVFPPPYTRLSDELVYLATKWVKVGDRASYYPYDFSAKGDINPDRVPTGPGPIVWAHGLPFFPVFRGYYVLTGREHASWIGWILREKTHQNTKNWPMWTIGPVVAPAAAVQLERSVIRQMYVHKPVKATDYEKHSEKTPCARDVVSMLHTHGTVLPMPEGFIVAPLVKFRGYKVHVGPPGGGMSAARIPGSYYRDNHISGNYYEAARSAPYVNQASPGVWEGGHIVGKAHFVKEDEDREETLENHAAGAPQKEKEAQKEDDEDEPMDDEPQAEEHSPGPSQEQAKVVSDAEVAHDTQHEDILRVTSDVVEKNGHSILFEEDPIETQHAKDATNEAQPTAEVADDIESKDVPMETYTNGQAYQEHAEYEEVKLIVEEVERTSERIRGSTHQRHQYG